MEKKSTKKQLQTKERKERVYQQAIRLFREQGYETTTIKDICEATGISVGSIYHFYENKAAILHQYGRELVGTRAQELISVTPDNCARPQEALLQYYIYTAKQFEDIGAELTKHIREDLNLVWLNSDGSYNEAAGTPALIRLVLAAQDAGTFDASLPAEEAVWYLQTACEGALSSWVLDHGEHSLTQSMERFMRRLLAGFSKKEERAS